jgi:hypothetical protein
MLRQKGFSPAISYRGQNWNALSFISFLKPNLGAGRNQCRDVMECTLPRSFATTMPIRLQDKPTRYSVLVAFDALSIEEQIRAVMAEDRKRRGKGQTKPVRVVR